MATILTNKPICELSTLIGHREPDNVPIFETIMLGMNKMAYIHIMSSSGKSEEEIKNFVDKYDEFINQYMIPLPDETNKL
jgi:hypothetical protein